jgi:hypothetical protein
MAPFWAPFFTKRRVILVYFHKQEVSIAQSTFCFHSNLIKPGIDVLNTIFGENLAFFSKTNVMITNLHNLPSFVLSQKRPFFRRIFWRKYLKNHNIGPSKFYMFRFHCYR